MRPLRTLTASLLAASLLLAPTGAQASDFSMMGHPGFIRSVILGLKERRAIRCLERWTVSGERQGLVPLAEAIVDRIAISTGFPDMARASLRFERRIEKPIQVELPNMFGGDAGQGDANTDAQGDGTAETMPAECALLAATYRQSGLDAALTMLGPAPAGPIPLPSPGTCLAFLKSRQQLEPAAMRMLVAQVRSAPETRLPVAERDRFLADVAAYRNDSEVTFGDPLQTVSVSDNDLVEMLCLASLTDLQIRLDPERAGPFEHPPRDHFLFRYGDQLLADLDAEIAEHPELLSDPAQRAALGLFEPPPSSKTE